MKFLTLIMSALVLLTSCSSEDSIEGLKSNEILAVSIDLADEVPIDKIVLTSTGGAAQVLGREIEDRHEVVLQTPQCGEGTFHICIYTNTDTLCSQEAYVEGGYRPKLKFPHDKFEVLDWL